YQRQFRSSEVRMVREVERFEAELNLVTFANPKVLHRGEIPRDQAGADHGVAADVAERAEGLEHECRRVEEAVRVLLASRQCHLRPGGVGAVSHGKLRLRLVGPGPDREGEAAL